MQNSKIKMIIQNVKRNKEKEKKHLKTQNSNLKSQNHSSKAKIIFSFSLLKYLMLKSLKSHLLLYKDILFHP